MSTAAMPNAGKTSLDELRALPRSEWHEGANLPLEGPELFHSTRAGLTYDLLWSPKPGAKRLFVLFSGDAMRSKNNPPVFQRWSWAPQFPGHCLYVSDPTLLMAPSEGFFVKPR